MAGRKLAVNVTTPDEDGRMVTFEAGGTVSGKVAEGITNPNAWGDSEPDDGEGDYSALKVGELRAEIDKRNEGRDDADLLSTEGKKADLIATLEADDE